MKDTTKMSRAVCQLEKMYNTLNADLFNGSIPTPIITVQSSRGSYGHCSCSKIWKRREDEAYELNISAEVLNDCIEEILDTIIHEMIHLYCRESGIQEVSRGGKYHNKKFKELAEQKMLNVFHTDKYGWNTIGKDNDKLTEYALSKDWSEIKISRGDITIGMPTGTPIVNPTTGEVTGFRAPSSTRKYQCPKCKNSVRATKCVNIACLDCNVKMEVVQ